MAKYSGKVGIQNFYYAVLDDDDKVETGPKPIRFLQEANIEFAQEVTSAYGDNRTAEIAVSNGDVTVNTAFHALPTEDENEIMGAEVVDGVSSYGGDDTPPYVAIVFEVTHNDGGSSWLGLTKGKFMRPSLENTTQEDSIEFGQDAVEGQFMDRDVDGFNKPKSYLKAFDEPDETENRDAIFEMIFGEEYPGEPESDGDDEETDQGE